MPPATPASRPSITKDQFYYDVINGLSGEQKVLAPKYFYDKTGSEYFDQICDLEEYYPYKTELKLLPQVAMSMARDVKGHFALVEFGAGSLLKVKPLLDCVDTIEKFIPIDISGDHLQHSCDVLKDEYPQLEVSPYVADFTQPLDITNYSGLQPLGFFPGSTIGNFTPEEAQKFLETARAILGKNSYLLIGVDTKKSPETLHKAYNDAQGVTAKFNLNVLERINRRFCNAIDVENFEHYAFYNAQVGRVEMHLVSKSEYDTVLDDIDIHFAQGESIHTESSYKYSPQDFTQLATASGWEIQHKWMAPEQMFSTYLLKNTVNN